MCIGFCADKVVVIPLVSEAKYAIGDTGPGGGIVFYIAPGANGTAIGTGGQNSIVVAINCMGLAANAAESYVLNGISGWFLPSKDELNKLYLNRGVVGGFANAYYWSSSQISDFWAWMQFFENGEQKDYSKNQSLRVRAVRDF